MWFYLKKEAVCFRNVVCCFDYLVKMENVLVNAADNTHFKFGWMSIVLRGTNALSQNVTWKLNYVLQNLISECLSLSGIYRLRIGFIHSDLPHWINLNAKTANPFFFSVELWPNAGHDLLILQLSRSHNDAPQSVGLLWTSDQLVAETSTWQHTTLTTDKHPCPPVGIEPTISAV